MKQKSWKLIFLEIVMIISTIIIFYPIVMIVLMSFKGDIELIKSPLSIPKEWVLNNYIVAFKKMNYIRVFLNTFFISLVSVSIGVVLCCLSGYAIVRARKHKKFFKIVYLLMIAGLILPAQGGLIPQVLLLKSMKLIGTYQGIILLYIGGAASFGVFMVSGFINTVPIELEESALIDGCSPYKIFNRIVLPLLKPTVITLLILNTIGTWNDFMTPLIFLQGSSSRTLPLAVFLFRGQYSTQWNILFSALVLALLPVLIFYFSLQKYIISGMTTGAVKM